MIRRFSTDRSYEVYTGKRTIAYNSTNALVRNPTWDIGLQKTGFINESGYCLATWIRTAASLIGFGFAMVQFFEGFNRMEGVKPPEDPHLARYLGLLLIGVGTLALGVIIWQYLMVVKHLRSEEFKPCAGISGMRPLFPSLVVAVLLCVIGALAFFIILVRGTQ